LSYSIQIRIVCHTVKPIFVASVERERQGNVERPLLREMLVWMVKDAKHRLGGLERPLLRKMNVLMFKDAEQKPGGIERPLL